MSYAGTIIAFPGALAKTRLTYFTRDELNQILNMYGRLVSVGAIRDYAIREERGQVSFSFFRRTSERPAYMIVKSPLLKKKQGTYRLVDSQGFVLKRGDNLKAILKVFEPKLLRLITA